MNTLHKAGGTPTIRIAHAQSVGQERDHNEDVLVTLTSTFAGDEAVPHFGLCLVADGMGGLHEGERASAIAARTITRAVPPRVYLALLSEPEEAAERPPLQEVLTEAFMEAHRKVSAAVPGGGTTATVALAIGRALTVAHVGDSRAYLVSDDELQLLTRDHSWAWRLYEIGEIPFEDVRLHPLRHKLYQAVGQTEGVRELEVDLYSRQVSPGTQLLLCSDGLWDMVDDLRLLGIIQEAGGIQAACERLVQAANDAGGEDNISVIMVEFAR